MCQQPAYMCTKLCLCIVNSTDPSLGETLLQDIKKFLQTEDEASEEIHTKSKVKESLAHQVLEENSNHNMFVKVRSPRLHEDYNSTWYNQTEQFDTSNLLAGTENEDNVNNQTILMKLRISG